ncbi:uncharacterized protein LOC128639742 [Bombina bombina]|uniref:uncharacterized protein LOC128639742 n=1 Tax=Bombina bombina TaxID=8345 RepID=UPI00235AB538|nr:uncharacterized protein LOC128639742 [Bombina bombina]
MFNWHKTFKLMPPWRRGKKTESSEGEVVLTHMKKLKNGNDNKLVEGPGLTAHMLLQAGVSNDLPIAEEQPKLMYENRVSELGATGSLCRLYKFESEDSGVEIQSRANSPSSPKGSEKSFVVHSRDSSCDSGVLSASSSPTVCHLEMCRDPDRTFLSDADLTAKGDPQTSVEDFINCQDENLDLSIYNKQNCYEHKVAPEELSRPEHSSVLGKNSNVMADFYQDTFDDIDDLHHELRRYPTSDSLDQYMDECCRLSEVNQGATKVLGSGFGYLEHICQLIEKLGQLQEHNLRLQKQIFTLQKEDKMKQMREEYFGHHCSCGAASVLLSSYLEVKNHFAVKRNRPHSMFVQSGNQSDLSMIPEITVNPDKFCFRGTPGHIDGRNSPSILRFRKPLNKIKYEESESKQVWERDDGGTQLQQNVKKLDIPPWGRVRDLLKKTKTRNQNKLGLTSTSLKRSCPQLYRPDPAPHNIKRKERNSMIILGQNPKRECAWTSLYVLNRKEEDM